MGHDRAQGAMGHDRAQGTGGNGPGQGKKPEGQKGITKGQGQKVPGKAECIRARDRRTGHLPCAPGGESLEAPRL